MANLRRPPRDGRSRRACRAARPPAAAEAALDPLPFDGEAAREYGGVFASVMAAGRKAHERSTCSSSQRRSRPGCRCTPGTATTSGHSTASGGRRRADGWHRGASQPAPHRQDPGRRSVCSLCACELHAGRTCRSAASPLKSTSAFTPAPLHVGDSGRPLTRLPWGGQTSPPSATPCAWRRRCNTRADRRRRPRTATAPSPAR